MALALLNYALLGGMVFGAGVAGYNNAENSCQAVKSAVETLKQAKEVQDKWTNAISNIDVLDLETVQAITENYTQIEILQNQIVAAQNHAKKTKIIVVALGITSILILFFYLLYRYLNTRIHHAKTISGIAHKKK
jgi:predicted small integral membrane protein